MASKEKIVIPEKLHRFYNGIWYRNTECCYTGCSDKVYGDENSIIGMRVFCPYHYNIIDEFLNSCENYWQVVVNVGGDTY